MLVLGVVFIMLGIVLLVASIIGYEYDATWFIGSAVSVILGGFLIYMDLAAEGRLQTRVFISKEIYEDKPANSNEVKARIFCESPLQVKETKIVYPVWSVKQEKVTIEILGRVHQTVDSWEDQPDEKE